MLTDSFGENVQHGLDVIAIAKLFEDLNEWDDAAKLYEHGLEISLPKEDFAKAVKRLAVLQRRRGDIGEAVRWWEKAANNGHGRAMEELAYLRARGVGKVLRAQSQRSRLGRTTYSWGTSLGKRGPTSGLCA